MAAGKGEAGLAKVMEQLKRLAGCSAKGVAIAPWLG